MQPANIEQSGRAQDVDRDDLVRRAPGLRAEASRSWQAVSAAIITRTAGEVTSGRSNHCRVTVALTALQGTAYIDGGPAQSLQFSPGELSFIPGGVATRTIMPATRVMQTLQRPAVYDTIISEMVRGGGVTLERTYPISDPLVLRIVSTLAHEMESGFLDQILVVDRETRWR